MDINNFYEDLYWGVDCEFLFKNQYFLLNSGQEGETSRFRITLYKLGKSGNGLVLDYEKIRCFAVLYDKADVKEQVIEDFLAAPLFDKRCIYDIFPEIDFLYS